MSNCKKCNELKDQLDQLKAYKMEAEEGKEINAELKEKLQNTTTSLYAHIGDFDKLTKEHVYLKNKYRKEIDKQRKSIERYKQAVTNIKELVENDWCYHHESCKLCTDTGSCINKQVLLKIKEYEV